ncbi:MAG: NEW3 domain-containing protein, partial [Chloroflexota bacterium]|nr:NEW3 domain-containing protein [Chloroflexota bacterium]
GTYNWFTSTDPDPWHEKLLDVSRLGPAGDFNVALSAPDPLGEAGGSREATVTLDRTPTHFETVALSASVPAGWSATFDMPTLTGFTADTATLTVTAPPSTPAGSYTIGVTASEGPHVHSATRQLVIENDLPTAHAPSAGIAWNIALGATTGPVLVSWPRATDPSSRIAAYEVETSVDYGPWMGTVGLAGVATSAQLTGLLGHSQRFRVRAEDAAGNWSDWQVGAPLSLAIVQDDRSQMKYSAGWHASADRWASGGSTRYTIQRGPTVRLTVRARQLAIVGSVARNRGSAAVYVNGVYQGTISFFSRVAASRRVVWTRTFPTDAIRTIEVRALGTVGRPRIDIDGILVGR